MIYILSIAVVIVLFGLLLSIYKTKSWKSPTQIIAAIVGALILAWLLYTCQGDD
jgi:hypothetical protein